MKILRVAFLATLAGGMACSSSSAKPGDGGSVLDAGTGSLYPLAVGNYWIYQVTDTDGTVSSEVVSVADQEVVGGTGPYAALMAFKLVSGSQINDPNGDRDWEAEVGMRVVRYREVNVGENKGNLKGESYWDPPRLRVDETVAYTAMDASWEEPQYTEYDIDMKTDGDAGTYIPDGGITMDTEDDIWTVMGVDEPLTISTRTFPTLHLKRVDKQSPTGVKEFWFTRGIGLVKETGAAKPTHELISYQVAPST